jgi:tRNA (guanine26-N2/guanine27-N2)-dimethyltransferase
MFKLIQEGQARVYIPKEEKISKKLPVFYNPLMALNRSISVLVLKNIPNKNMQIGLPLAGTGIRGIRLLKELPKNKIKFIYFNDNSKNAVNIIKKNLRLNKIKSKIKVFNKDANLFILENRGFDYIDIDPFGTPNPFLDSAVKALSRNSVLAVTATDTAPLAGTYPAACRRKYWASPKLDSNMHETGLRILIRKIQLIAAQYEKALTPALSYYHEHYFRVFFRCEKGKIKVDNIINQHGMFNNAGPLWLGKLWDCRLVNQIAKQTELKIIKTISQECKINTIGFIDIHKFCKKHKLKIPKTEVLLKKINASQTHFSPTGIRTNISENQLKQIIQRLS